MNKEEFDKLKEGDIVYIVPSFSLGYYKAAVVEKGTTLIRFLRNKDEYDLEWLTYTHVFTTEEKAKQEVIRKAKDSIRTNVSLIRRLMTSLHTFDNNALNDKLLLSITDAISKEFYALKAK